MKNLSRAVSHLSLVIVLLAAAPTIAHDQDGGVALALGDSVAFGYITKDGYAYVNPENFLGYPQYLGFMLHMDTVNAACPGEATTGFLSPTGADNGCDEFKANFPLHVSYHGAATQLAFATALLKHEHHKVRLVTLQLGANDGFLLEEACAGDPSCIAAGIPDLTAKVATNIGISIADLRATGYAGPIIVANYYSTDYTNPSATALVSYLNAAISGAAAVSGAAVADLFSAFKTAATAAGGKTCVAGLLNVDPANSNLPAATCDVHPSQSGQQLIARTIAATYLALRW
jgi:lysophospholipase L1-like esterase